jgi:hypothetical protein
MLPAIQDALLDLDVRTLAVTQIVALLESAGDVINVDFTRDATVPAKRKGKMGMDTLRKDPKLRTLLEAYDLSKAIEEAT